MLLGSLVVFLSYWTAMGEICIAKDFESLYNGKHTIETCIVKNIQRFFVVCCIMFLSYRITFLCNVVGKLIIHQKVLYDIFYEKKL